MTRLLRFSFGLLTLGFMSACTGQVDGAFPYTQQVEDFNSNIQINTKIDLLWVVDNSSSMDVIQKSLREKIAPFAQAYLSPNWDIKIGVITTDTYLANDVFQTYLNTKMAGSGVNKEYKSAHVQDLITTLGAGHARVQKLVSDLNVNTTAGIGQGNFTQGLLFKDLVPVWGRGNDYARLLAGVHDGPIPGLCIERLPYFITANGGSDPLPDCSIRDASTRTGVETCLRPTAGLNSVTECVNTFLNDTVHSGSPIVSTQLPTSGYTSSAWVNKITDDFTVNVSVGSTGSGSERGLGSLVEFLNQNEASGSDSKFFRQGALKGIIFLSDEDDQTMTLPSVSSIPSGFSPTSTDYQCDLDALVDANTSKFANAAAARTYISTTYKLCCSDGSCLYRDLGCPAKVVEGTSFKVGVCPDTSKLQDPVDVASDVTSFFTSLEGAPLGENNGFFSVAIVPTEKNTITNMRAGRNVSDDRVDDLAFYVSPASATTSTQVRVRIPAVDEGTRYKAFTAAVGNGSSNLDIGAPDYSVMLDSIGRTLIEKKSRFKLRFKPTTQDEMIISIVHADGTKTIVEHADYTIDGYYIVLTDEAMVLGLKDSDHLKVDYQPSSLVESHG